MSEGVTVSSQVAYTALCHSTAEHRHNPDCPQCPQNCICQHFHGTRQCGCCAAHTSTQNIWNTFKHCSLMMALRNYASFTHPLPVILERCVSFTPLLSFRSRKGKKWLDTVPSSLQAPGTDGMLWSPRAARTGVWNLRNLFWSLDP